jgi:hypothetical protein
MLFHEKAVLLCPNLEYYAHMVRRIHSIILLIALLIGSAGMNYVRAAVYSGTCGAAGNEANVTWELDTETGRLVIGGTGPMTHYWSLQDIPWYNYRQYVTSITVYYGVTALGHHAFYDCPNVTTVSLYSGLTSIGVLSFAFCRKLTTLEIPVNVASIGDQALWYNESLRDVHVKWTGDAVPTMPSNIHNFEASKIRLHIPCGQTAAYVAKGWNTKFALIEGLYVGTMETTTNYFPWVLTCDSVWMVSGTGVLNDFPNPMYAVVMDIRVTVNGSKLSPVFSERNVVKGAVFEEGITYIGNNTLYKGAYHSGYPYLTTLTLPSTLTSMSSTAFKGCIALKDVYVSWTTAAAIPTWNQSIDVSQATLHVPCGTTALYRAKGWQDYTIVEDRAHGTCGANGDNLTWTLSCDGTLTISGTGAMYNWMTLADRPWHSLCTSIQRVVIEEGVTTTGFHAFYNASNLTSVSLPSTLQTLQFMTFFGCGKLTTLTIPSSVTYVGDRSLEGCSALTDVYMSETGDAIPTMPVRIHTYDASQIRLHIPCGQAGAYYAKGWNAKFTIDGVVSGTCGDNVQWTFESCNGTLTIFGTGPMAKYAYTNQVPWYSFRESITSVTIANGVTTIGQPAFYNCSNLTSVSIGTGVTTICRQAFQNCTNLPSITIGDHVTTIERKAFDNCSGLTSITIPPSVTSIGEEAFNGCYAMESLYITDLTAWCNISFDGIYATPFIRNGYASYRGGGNLFLNGIQVTTLTIPDGVTEIKHYTFYGFAGITDVQFNQVTTIGRSAFNSNHGLTDITIPEGVTIINPNAFNYCTSLQSISIPESVTAIGNRALRTTALTDIYVYWTGNIPAWDELTNKYPQSDITLHVPCSAMSLYKVAEGWKDYTIEGEGGPYTITVESDDPTMGTVDARKIDN